MLNDKVHIRFSNAFREVCRLVKSKAINFAPFDLQIIVAVSTASTKMLSPFFITHETNERTVINIIHF